ncbi:hypothetical protein Adt_42573 [Abeliophyllum distichum]|uniref:Uncharacterized protein n=1 Tax=Abeliophyllum distichum TaxID=126358 RepID=A0ABD1PS22_9LAMI
MADVLPIRSIDISTGEEMAIALNPRLSEVGDPFITDLIRWAAMDVSSIMVEEDMRLLKESYMIFFDIGLMIPELNERACFLRRGCTALHLHAFVGGLRLPMHLFFEGLCAHALPRCQLSSNDIEVLRLIYHAPLSSQRYGFLLNRQRCLTELGLMTSRGSALQPYYFHCAFDPYLFFLPLAAEMD